MTLGRQDSHAITLSDVTLRLELLIEANRDAALALRVRPDQELYVATVDESLRDASEHRPEAVWQRLIYDGDTRVGFVMAGWFDGHPDFDSGLWRLLVGAEHQGKGYGRFAVSEVVREARRRGRTKLTVFYHPGPDGPKLFYEKLGFRRNGKSGDGAEVQAELLFP